MKQHISILLISIAINTYVHAQPLIEKINVYKKTLWVIPNQEFKSRYLRKNFYVQYGNNLKLNKMPQSIVLIPFFMNVAPMVWHSGLEYTVPEMDEDQYYALKKIKATFKQFYQTLSWNGEIIPEKLVKNNPKKVPNQPKVATLFSGGLDAVCTSMRYADHKQLLITIWGSDIHYNKVNLWQEVKSNCKSFAEKYGHAHAWVRSNFLSFIEHSYVSHLTPQIPKWWAHTLQGMGYTSLTAPILYAKGIKHLLIGSTRTREWPFPYGTHPAIDGHISFAGTKVFHDGASFDRIEKIESIQQSCRTFNLPKPPLRVCWGYDEKGGNCGSCEKCLRTIIELIIAYEDPKDWGFNIPYEHVSTNIQNYFKNIEKITSGLRWHWGCIQRQLKNRNWNSITADQSMIALFNWIVTHDFWQHVQDHQQYTDWLPKQHEFVALWDAMNITYLNRSLTENV